MKRVILTVATALILLAVVWAVGLQETVAAVREAGLNAFVLVGLTVGATLLLRTVAWAMVNYGTRQPVPFKSLLAAEVVGEAGNTVTPSRNFGGEPFKILYVVRSTSYQTDEVAGSVLLTKYLEILSFVLFVVGSAIIAVPVYHDVLLAGPSLASRFAVPALAVALLLLFFLVFASLAKGWRPITRLLTWLAVIRLARGPIGRVIDAARRMEDQASRAFQRQPKVAFIAFLTLAATHVVIMVRPSIFLFLGYGEGLGLFPLCLIFLSSQALLSLQFTPSAIGTLDGGLVGVFILLGLDNAQCLAFLLCLRLCDACLVACGAWLAARMGATSLSKRLSGFPEGTRTR